MALVNQIFCRRPNRREKKKKGRKTRNGEISKCVGLTKSCVSWWSVKKDFKVVQGRDFKTITHNWNIMWIE
jgi:hypothetical protein